MASNYPLGADNDPSAPWNEPTIPEKDFDIQVTVTLSKVVKVTTDKYIPEHEDKDGYTCADTSNTDWGDVYNESEHYTIQELLNVLKGYIQQDMERYKGSVSKELQLKALLESCKNWNVDEELYEEQ